MSFFKLWEVIQEDKRNKIIELLQSGQYSIPEIAQMIGTQHQNTISRILKTLSLEVQEIIKEKGKQNQKQKALERWQNMEFTEKQKFREKARERMLKQWQDPKHIEKIKQIYENPELREKMKQARIKELENRDFWEWIKTFTFEKQKQIISAIVNRNKNITEEEKNIIFNVMINKVKTGTEKYELFKSMGTTEFERQNKFGTADPERIKEIEKQKKFVQENKINKVIELLQGGQHYIGEIKTITGISKSTIIKILKTLSPQIQEKQRQATISAWQKRMKQIEDSKQKQI